MKKEIRKLDLQFRAEDTEDGKMEIKGYAAVFNSPETYGYTELISERAFDEADMSDVVLQDDITDHRNIFNAIKSGLIDKQSFAFVVDEDEYDYDTDTRTITKIGKVFDVSVVDQPFYNATDVSVARNQNDEFMERRNELRKEEEEKREKQKLLDDKKKELLEKLG